MEGGGGQFDPPQEKLLSKSSALLGLRINLSDLWCILVISNTRMECFFYFLKVCFNRKRMKELIDELYRRRNRRQKCYTLKAASNLPSLRQLTTHQFFVQAKNLCQTS